MELLVSCPRCGRSYARMFLKPGDARCRCGAILPRGQEKPARPEDRRPPRPKGGVRRLGGGKPPGMDRPGPGSRVPSGVDPEALRQEEAALQELRRLADHISFLIVATDTPRIDVDIVRANARRRCQELFPDKMHVYEMVYESRFQRLWQQFRAA